MPANSSTPPPVLCDKCATEVDEVPGFDPETDEATTSQKGRIKQAYETELRRGNEESAGAIRREPRLRDQAQLAREIKEFDPKHDDVQVVSKLRVKQTYEALLEAGHEEAAEELRWTESYHEQKSLAIQLRRKYEVTV